MMQSKIREVIFTRVARRKECRLRMTGRSENYGRGRGQFRGRGRGNNLSRGGHQLSYCKTQTDKKTDATIERIYQSKADNSDCSDIENKEGCG